MFVFALILLVAASILMSLMGKFKNKGEGYNYTGVVRNFSIGGIILAVVLIFISFIRVYDARPR